MRDRRVPAIIAIKQLAQAIKDLREAGVIRSTRFTGDLGEWYAQVLYKAESSPSRSQKGWDLLLPADGMRLQVKTQSYDLQNRWNYLRSDPSLFDRLIVVILTEALMIRDIYDVPSEDLIKVLRVGRDGATYHWDDLARWRVQPEQLPGYAELASLIEGE